MSIEIAPAKELGEKYPATIWKAEPVEGQYGPQVYVGLVETNGNMLSLYLPVPATTKNRTGRVLTSLHGQYPTGTYDEQTLVGMTVDCVYAQKKGGEPGDLVLDLLKPRTPAKGEDPAKTVETVIEREESSAPF